MSGCRVEKDYFVNSSSAKIIPTIWKIPSSFFFLLSVGKLEKILQVRGLKSHVSEFFN